MNLFYSYSLSSSLFIISVNFFLNAWSTKDHTAYDQLQNLSCGYVYPTALPSKAIPQEIPAVKPLDSATADSDHKRITSASHDKQKRQTLSDLVIYSAYSAARIRKTACIIN